MSHLHSWLDPLVPVKCNRQISQRMGEKRLVSKCFPEKVRCNWDCTEGGKRRAFQANRTGAEAAEVIFKEHTGVQTTGAHRPTHHRILWDFLFVQLPKLHYLWLLIFQSLLECFHWQEVHLFARQQFHLQAVYLIEDFFLYVERTLFPEVFLMHSI